MSDSPNVLLLVFDTLRPDFLSCYTSDSPVETPNIDRVATSGTLFENAFSAGPGTEISHAALFSGQFPSETGLVGGAKSIPEETPLLAEQFSANGYETWGVSGPGKIRSDLGFDRGFDDYVEPYYETLHPDISVDYLTTAITDPFVRKDFARTLRNGPDSLTDLKFNLLEDRLQDADAPFFGFVNFLTCHSPYDPPRPFKSRATPNLSRSQIYLIDLLKEILGRESEQISDANVRNDRVLRAARCLGQPYHADPDWLTEEELDILRRWYGAAVSYLDQRFGEFLDFLSREGLDQSTLLVLCSDHGEHLGEHGLLYHGDFLYDEVIHVPLILSGPGVPIKERRTDLVSLVDIFDTLCDLTEIPAPDSVTGQSLFDSDCREHVFAEYGVRDTSESRKEPYLSEDDLKPYEHGLKCVRTKTHKLVYRSDDVTELYRLPDEDEIVTDETVTEQLTDVITENLGTDFAHTSDPVVDETKDEVKKNLDALGYT